MQDEELRQSFQDAMIVHNAVLTSVIKALDLISGNRNVGEGIEQGLRQMANSPETWPSLKRQIIKMADFIGDRERAEFNPVVIDGGKSKE